MDNATATQLPAQTVVACIEGLIDSGSIGLGARRAAVTYLSAEARRCGFDPALPISGDVLDTLVVDGIPARLWLAA